MYFEAELKGRKYKVDVTELRAHWKLAVQEEGKDWIYYEVSKNDFKGAEEYVSFLFNGQSYLIDVIGSDTEYTVFTRNSFRTIKIYNDEILKIYYHSRSCFSDSCIVCIILPTWLWLPDEITG